jgi:hypothetical protein
MPFEPEPVYPNCPTITRTVTVGSLTSSELVEELRQNAILMNESAERLFASDQFATSPTRYSVTTVELTVRDLGFPQGATIAELFARATTVGLSLCPIELGAHLRLQYRDQPEGARGKPVRRHQAPYGSITVASEPLSDEEDFPKGFYLRCIEGVLWLRGYRSGPEHVWGPDDHFIFRQA